MKARTLARIALLCGLALSIGACRSAPVLEPQIDVAMFATSGKLTDAQVADAIKRAGSELGWQMEDAGPGRITGTLVVRNRHRAVTDIRYSPQQVRIAYKDSAGL